MHVFITGASGLAGHAITQAALERGFRVTAQSCSHDLMVPPQSVRPLRLDFANPQNAVAALLDDFPDVIIHTAALSRPAGVEADPERAEKLNVALPRQLAQVAHHLSARIIHLSSDLVFDGEDPPYTPTALPNPMSLYGQLKLLAEREVLKYAANFAVVLRIPLLTGDSPSGTRSVHEALFHSWAEGKTARLYEDEIRQPLSVINLAAAVVEICERPSLSGIFHWAGSEALSRHTMGMRIVRHFGLPEHLVEAARIGNNKRPRDLRFDLAPLHPKLRTQPIDFASQLETMHPPPLCRAWYESMRLSPAADSPAAKQRLVRGRDF